ncbi:PQ loop repeat-domain-containing protein [Dipodascopsis tothii]|uniref:PQ loop repeat-domain-containing protein n=1 Tax=Dipodascopsis tothii TaxID=44089 RepID=UPI0034CE0DC0
MTDMLGHCPYTDERGLALVEWIARSTGSCMYGTLGALSYIFGYLSLFAWLGAQLPQVVANYRNHSVEALSWMFLFQWFMGDFTNLIGCLLTHQLPFQTLLATYYLCIDVILGSQYVYYTKIRPQTHYVLLSPTAATASSASSRTLGSPRRRANVLLSLSALVALVGADPGTLAAADPSYLDSVRRWFSLKNTETVGRAFAWLCTFLYLSSRAPQIYRNYKRQSTTGLAILLFVAAFLGNVFYTLSILCSAATMDTAGGFQSERAQFLSEELPYILGSAGTVGFDITIFIQWIHYGEGKLWFYRMWYGDKAFGFGVVEDDSEDDAESFVDEASTSTSSATTLSLDNENLRLHLRD